MLKKTAILGIAALLALPLMANAGDTILKRPIKEALMQPTAKQKLGSDIKYYFADEKHPKVAKDFGEYETNKKTNAFGKNDAAVCNWVFLSAMLQLQEKAHDLGADGVINIRSNFKNQEFASQTEFKCGVGFLMAGVALKGDFVKFADKK